MVSQLLQETFELDGRVVKSLKLLLFKPGALAQEFSNNRRATFVSPIRLYLFTSILFFAVTAIVAPDIRTQDFKLDPTDAPAQVQPGDIRDFKALLDPALHRLVDQIVAKEGFAHDTLLRYIEEVAKRNEPPSFFQSFMDERVVLALDDPLGTLESFFEQLPIALFFLLPAYAGLLKLVYLRQHKYYVEHLVFALHLHAFAFLLFTALVLLPASTEQPWATIGTTLQVIFFVYYFIALRRYYEQSRSKTLAKYVFLLSAYSILLLPAILLVMLITFAFI